MLRRFFGDLLPEQGGYCLLLLPQRQHVWADSLDELAQEAEHLLHRAGVYFGTAAFQSFASRKQSNVLSLKALRLDIDAGSDKLARHGEEEVYATQQEAIAAVVAFCKQLQLPPTYIVSSGQGLHVYFCLRSALEPAAWLPLARALAAAGRAAGLKIDASCTEDTARVLRVPGSQHESGTEVRVLRHLPKFYGADELQRLLGAATPVARTFDTSINDELDLGYQGPPSSALKIVQHCAALRHVAQTRGDVPEPYWRAMIGLVKRTTEGLDIAQKWSSGYDGYDEREVERKFDAWATGPTTCREFSRHSDACAACPHNGRVKSPIALGLMTTEEVSQLPEDEQTALQLPPTQEAVGEPWEGRLPAGFSVVRPEKGRPLLVMTERVERESPTGEMVPAIQHIPVTHDIFWFGQWAEAEHSDDTAQVTLHLWAGTHIKRYVMDQSVMASAPKLLEFLSGKAIHTTTHKKAPAAMQAYAKAQLMHIHSDFKNFKVTDRLGLRTLDSGELVCVHGKHAIFPDGSVRETMLGAQLRALAESFRLPVPQDGRDAWGPQLWDHVRPRAERHVQFLRDFYGSEGMERFQLAIMLGLASPFMAFVTGEYAGGAGLPVNSALTVSLYSRETARGKTSCAQAALAAFGRTSELTNDNSKAGATTNGRLGRLSLLGTMPNIMDEMTNVPALDVAVTVSSVANGTGRQTMTSARQLRREPAWALINYVTTNKSQRAMVAAAGASGAGPILYRMLEIDVDNMPTYSLEQRARYREEWASINLECAGALGALIHREICALGLEGVTRLVAQCVTRAEHLIGADQSARFQSRGLGAMLALATVLHRLGLTPFALAPLVEQFKAAYDNGVEFVEESVAGCDNMGLLARALLDLAPHTLVTAEDTSGKGFSRVMRALNARIPDKIVARHIQSTGITYLSTDALAQWCREHNEYDRAIIREARQLGVLVPRSSGGAMISAERKVLTAGLADCIPLTCRAYTINVGKLNRLLGDAPVDMRLVVSNNVDPDEPVQETGTE